MTKRRPIIAAVLALTTVAGGIVASGSAGAETYNSPRRSTTTLPPKLPRTKNAALPTTTKPKTVSTPPLIRPRTKNAALPTSTTKPTATTRPRTVTTPLPPVNTIKR